MKHIFIPLPVFISNSWLATAKNRKDKLALCTTQEKRRIYLKAHPDWGLLKSWLETFSDKCWYCEVKSTRASVDVDHFRPKLLVTVMRRQVPNHDGYFWLAYDWDNYRLSCQRCNRPEKDLNSLFGKANEFALQVETDRCDFSKGKISVSVEKPLLLDPCCEQDTFLLAHPIDGEVKPTSLDVNSWDYKRAKYTIDVLGLNSFDAPLEKRRAWSAISALIRTAGLSPREYVKNVIKSHLEYNAEYSSFFRSSIGAYKTKKWVQDLL